jgi:hypothetical protein
MKIETHLDSWGGIILTVKAETVHENTLLNILSGKRVAECSGMVSGRTDIPSTHELTFTFREHDAPKPVEVSAEVTQ